MSDALKELLVAEPRRTLAVAESLTCGHLQARVGAVSGASGYFLGGVTAYTLDRKVALLGVDRAAAAAVNCVSEDVARQMAAGAARMFGSDFGAATTGYAEPDPAGGVVEPFACWALARRDPGGGPWVYRSGRVVGVGLSRTRMQALVAETVYAELTGFVRDHRGT